MIIAESVQAAFQDVHDFGHAVAEVVSEVVLPGVFPDVLRRIEFRAVRRKEDRGYRRRDHEVGGFVPSGAVHADGAMLSGEAVRYVGKEEGGEMELVGKIKSILGVA